MKCKLLAFIDGVAMGFIIALAVITVAAATYIYVCG